ncbi:MAG TPA: hypothetical protein VFK20_03780 [Vicinamibacterales bacterium]|nr:hypothetical protein [Vicinamibacterales bacterium]
MRQTRLLAALVILAVWGLMTHGTYAGTGDEPHYLMIAHSLAFDGDLDLTNDYREATLIGGGALQPEHHAIPHDGRLRPVHDIGMPLLFVPVLRVAYPVARVLADRLPASVLRAARLNASLLLRHQISLVMALLTALLARELLLVLTTIGGKHPFGWALLFALCPPILSHAYLFFTEIPTALGAFIVLRRLTVTPIAGWRAAVACGVVTGFLWLIHVRNVGLVGGLVLVAAMAVRERRISVQVFGAFIAGVLAMLAARTLVTYVVWSRLVTTPHAAIGGAGSVAAVVREMSVRATGLLFDREYGLLAYAPIYVLAGPGLIVLWRSARGLAAAAATVIACYLLPILLPMINVHGWTGGWAPAARFLVPIAPLFWLGVFAVASRANAIGRPLVTALVAAQIAIDAYVWQFPKTLWSDGDGVSSVPWTAWLPSWTDADPWLSFALGVCVMLALCAFADRLARPAARSGLKP